MDRPRGSRVLELPTGRQVGRWSLAAVGGGTREWTAVPDLDDGNPGLWRVQDPDGDHVIRESVESKALDRMEQPVLRVPGWVGAALQPGRPAALLVECLARHRARDDRPLWVPSVDADGVRFLLGLPGPIWVDGPGVPGD